MNQPVSSDSLKKPHDHDHSQHDHAHEHKHSCCAPKPAAHAHGCCSGSSEAPALIQLRESASADARISRFRIEAMDCPTEQTLIQNKLGKLDGVEQLEFNLINRVLGVRHTFADTQPIEQAIASLGMHAEPMTADTSEAAPAPAKKAWWPLALSG